MNTLLNSFLHLLSDTVVPFVLGLLLGAALEAFLPRKWTERWLASGPNSLVIATIAGALLPGCAMSTVPIARSLRARGAPLGTVAAFLLIAPLISPHTIVFTAALIGGGFAVARVVLPLAFTLAFGAVANALVTRSARPPEESAPAHDHDAACCGTEAHGGHDCGCHGGGEHDSAETRPAGPFGRLVRQVIANLRALAPLYVGSLAVVAVLTAFVQPAQIAHYGNGPLAYAAALVAGIPLYVCDGGEIPLTRSLLALGLGAGPAFTFMLASVGTCLPTIAMSFGIIGRRLTFAYVAGMLVLALLGGLIVAAWPLLQPALAVS